MDNFKNTREDKELFPYMMNFEKFEFIKKEDEIMDKKNAFARKTQKQKTEEELEKDVFDTVKTIIEEKQNNLNEKPK